MRNENARHSRHDRREDCRNKIVNKLKQRLEPLDYVYALWLEGADAHGAADEYSDIDLWADIEDAYEDEAIAAAESALLELGEFDYRTALPHGHPQIRQRAYHLAGTSEYLMIDFCFQLHSRPRDYAFYENDPVEGAKVIFDKAGVIQVLPGKPPVDKAANAELLEEMRYRYTQHARVIKYVRRGQYPEAFAYYQRYVLEPLVCLLRLIHTPAYADYGYVHISRHVPKEQAQRLEYFARIASLEDIETKTPEAKTWFEEMALQLKYPRER